MKTFNKIRNISLAVVVAAIAILGCNKAPLPPVPNTPPTQETSPTLSKLLDDPEFSILKAGVAKAGLTATLNNPNLRFTIFAPDDAAFIASGIPMAAIDALPVSSVAGLIGYHIVPQVINSGSIPGTFPNFQYPTIVNPAPQLSALLRLTTFPSHRDNGDWVNNIPITELDIPAVNGVMHKIFRVTAPPSQYLWNRIDTDPELTFLKAAITRADEGTGTLKAALLNIGANLTVFAPTNDAFIASGIPDIAAINGLPVQSAQAIVTYHILGKRAFTNNIFTAPTAVPTLFNGAVPAHPGVTINAEFTGLFVSAATAKGAANANASNLLIDQNQPSNTDQHYLNGVLHKIDQVLKPF